MEKSHPDNQGTATVAIAGISASASSAQELVIRNVLVLTRCPEKWNDGKKSGNERWWNGNGNQLWKLEGERYLYIFSHCLLDKMGTWKTSSNIVSASYEVGLKHHSLRIDHRMKIISPRPPWERRQASIFPRFFPTLSRSRSCEIISCKLGFSWYFLSAQSRSHSCIRGSKFPKLALIFFCFTHLPVKKGDDEEGNIVIIMCMYPALLYSSSSSPSSLSLTCQTRRTMRRAKSSSSYACVLPSFLLNIISIPSPWHKRPRRPWSEDQRHFGRTKVFGPFVIKTLLSPQLFGKELGA